jgi:hypothetical protein
MSIDNCRSFSDLSIRSFHSWIKLATRFSLTNCPCLLKINGSPDSLESALGIEQILLG